MIVGVLVVVLPLSLWGRCRYYREAFQRIDPGYAQEQVVAVLGRPISDLATHQTVPKTWRDDEGFAIAGEMAREYRYGVPLQPLHEWAIGFDAAGRVIVKNELISP